MHRRREIIGRTSAGVLAALLFVGGWKCLGYAHQLRQAERDHAQRYGYADDPDQSAGGLPGLAAWVLLPLGGILAMGAVFPVRILDGIFGPPDMPLRTTKERVP